MDNCQDKAMFSESFWKALMKLPTFRYMKAPVDNVAQLYEKYPAGMEKGAFAFVYSENTFYMYYPALREWKAMLTGIGSIAVHLGTSPTQQQLTDAWVSVKNDAPTDGAMIINLDQDEPLGHDWIYMDTSAGYAWIDRGIDTVNLATNTAPGIVKGRAYDEDPDNIGYASITETGEIKINGWDDLWAYFDHMCSGRMANSLADLPVTQGNIDATVSSGQTLSFTNLAGMSAGYITRIRVTNTGISTITITLPTASPIENDYGPSTQLGAGEKIEFELWCYAPGKYRLKKYNMMYIMNVNPVFTGFDKDGN
ncbi:MAG: hypothetical protein LBL79_02640 [Prevotella sp.]|jgi:hypothetical protein|nr:hypothetical protein [Prevotella sp.]